MQVLDYFGRAHEMPGPFPAISVIKNKVASTGNDFFSPETMRFFKSRVAPGVISGRLFITSEKHEPMFGEPEPRAYTVRLVSDDGSIESVGPVEAEDTYQAFPTLDAARTWARKYAAGEVQSKIASWVKSKS